MYYNKRKKKKSCNIKVYVIIKIESYYMSPEVHAELLEKLPTIIYYPLNCFVFEK